jgi:hypothetical protein
MYPKSKTGHETPMMTYFGERTSLVPSFSGFGTPELKFILFSENSLPQ